MYSLTRLFPDGVEIELHGQCTDSGGGGTLKALADKLRSKFALHPHYIIASCKLHNVQTYLCNAVLNVMGDGCVNDLGD